MSDRRSLSRRKLLWAIATTGAAASVGSGTAAFMSDSEIVSGSMTAGILDLDTDPSWGNDSSFGTASKGDEGTETVTLSVSDNPSYLWFRTKCAQCTQIEEAVFVRFGIDTDGDGSVDQWLTGDYLSLREARERYGEGVNLGELGTTETWELVVEWEVREAVKEETNVDFDFDFYATQSRHVMNTDSVAPDWQCPGDCDGTGGPGGDPDEPSAISWVAFCSSKQISSQDIAFERSDDGRTLVVSDLSPHVDTILMKYGTKLDLFRIDPESQTDQMSFTAGDGTTYLQDGNSYPGTDTDPARTNSVPCPDSYGCKYEFPDENGPGGWECHDPLDSTTESRDSSDSVLNAIPDVGFESTGGER